MKTIKMIIISLMLVLSMGVAKGQGFVFGNALFPSVGVMRSGQTMDDNIGFYIYGLYGHSNKPSQHMQNGKVGGGLAYIFSNKKNSQDCLKVYGGLNGQIFWDVPNYEDGGYYENGTHYPKGFHFMSFDVGVSKSFDNGVSFLLMYDALNNNDWKVGFSYRFGKKQYNN